MGFEINTGGIRAWRLWLATRIAPAGADVHDPGRSVCPGAGLPLTAVAWSQVERRGQGQYIDVAADLDDMAGRYDLIDADGYGGYTLTERGEREVARVWGPGRVPPWGRWPR